MVSPVQDLRRFPRPYDWLAIDDAVETVGGCIAERFFDDATVTTLNAEVDAHLVIDPAGGLPVTGTEVYDTFLGHDTLRFHGVVEKFPSTAAMLDDDELVAWVERTIGDAATSVLMNAAELIEIKPGESRQFPHRDTDSWPPAARTEDPIIVNAIVALDRTTAANGATWVAPGSHRWDDGHRWSDDDFARAELDPGDAVLFRGDVVHGGGANTTDARRRVISLSYCVGWLRPVENSFLNVGQETLGGLSPRLQAMLGYAPHTAPNGGMVGLYENGDPAAFLRARA